MCQQQRNTIIRTIDRTIAKQLAFIIRSQRHEPFIAMDATIVKEHAFIIR
jgi:hypothetical protein